MMASATIVGCVSTFSTIVSLSPDRSRGCRARRPPAPGRDRQLPPISGRQEISTSADTTPPRGRSMGRSCGCRPKVTGPRRLCRTLPGPWGKPLEPVASLATVMVTRPAMRRCGSGPWAAAARTSIFRNRDGSLRRQERTRRAPDCRARKPGCQVARWPDHRQGAPRPRSAKIRPWHARILCQIWNCACAARRSWNSIRSPGRSRHSIGSLPLSGRANRDPDGIPTGCARPRSRAADSALAVVARPPEPRSVLRE
jgi:hypothetical protein